LFTKYLTVGHKIHLSLLNHLEIKVLPLRFTLFFPAGIKVDVNEPYPKQHFFFI